MFSSNHMLTESRANEFQGIQKAAEYMITFSFSTSEQYRNLEVTIF